MRRPGEARGTAACVVAVWAGWWTWRHRTSAAVRGWTPPVGLRSVNGPLSVRVLGGGGPVLVLLHGLTASGDTFGRDFTDQSQSGTVVVPDLLGFGSSFDVPSDDFSLDAHLDALDETLGGLGLGESSLVVVGHSLGAVLALHWAARRAGIDRVVAFSAPLYDSEDEARRHIARMGPLERFFALESPLARWTCSTMCTFRGVAQWVAVAISPEWPIRIARHGVLHTWPAYLGVMNGIILNPEWRDALDMLSRRGVPVVLANGARDPVPVKRRAARLAHESQSIVYVEHATATHDLPVSFPDWAGALANDAATPPSQG